MSEVTCVITSGCCMPCTHAQASFCCSVEPPAPRSMVSPPSGAITVWPALFVGMGTMPNWSLYFQPFWLSSGKIHGPLTIIAACPCMNCWVRSGSWPQFSTDFEAEPSLTMLTHSCRADWTGGRVHLGQAGPVAPEERLELPGRLLVSGGVEGHPVHRRLGQLLGV